MINIYLKIDLLIISKAFSFCFFSLTSFFMVLYDFIIQCFGFTSHRAVAVTFFVAYPVTIFSPGKTYKRCEQVYPGIKVKRARLCSRPGMNVVFLLSKKKNSGGSGSGSK